jgi:hypothetical protein
VGVDVVRVKVPAGLIMGQDDIWPQFANQAGQPGGNCIQWLVDKRIRMEIGFIPLHARVAIPHIVQRATQHFYRTL